MRPPVMVMGDFRVPHSSKPMIARMLVSSGLEASIEARPNIQLGARTQLSGALVHHRSGINNDAMSSTWQSMPSWRDFATGNGSNGAACVAGYLRLVARVSATMTGGTSRSTGVPRCQCHPQSRCLNWGYSPEHRSGVRMAPPLLSIWPTSQLRLLRSGTTLPLHGRRVMSPDPPAHRLTTAALRRTLRSS
jgi:hypothetical protein